MRFWIEVYKPETDHSILEYEKEFENEEEAEVWCSEYYKPDMYAYAYPIVE